MATHSSILVWKIPWTEEPGGLQSVGLRSQTGLRTPHSNAVLSMRSHSSNDAVLSDPALRLTFVFPCSIVRILTSLNRLSSCLRYNFLGLSICNTKNLA